MGELVELCDRLGLNCQRLSWNGCSSLLMAGAASYDPMLLYAHLEDQPPAPGESPCVPPTLLDAASSLGLEPWAIGVYLPESCRERPSLSGAESFIEAITRGPAWTRQLLCGGTWQQHRSQIRVSYELQLEWELYATDGEFWLPLQADSIPSRGHSGHGVTRLVTRRLDPDFEMAFDPLQLVHAAFLGDWYTIGTLLRDGRQDPLNAVVAHGQDEIIWYAARGGEQPWAVVFQKEAFQTEVRRALDEGVQLCRLHQIEDHPELPGGRLALERLTYQLGEEGGLKHPVAGWFGSCRKNRGWSDCLRPLVCGDES